MKIKQLLLIGLFFSGVSARVAQREPVIYYLGVLSDRNITNLVCDDLRAAGVSIVDFSEDLILFRVDDKSHKDLLVRELAYFKSVLTNPSDALSDPPLRQNRVSCVFADLYYGSHLNSVDSGQWSAFDRAIKEKSTSLALPANQSNAPVAGIDAVLAIGGTITGKVTNSAGASVSSTAIRVFDSSQPYTASGWVKSATAQANGTYIIQGLRTGTYKVYFWPYSGNYLPKWYSSAGSFESAGSVAVTAGSVTSNIDATLNPGGTISGRLANSAGDGLFGAAVQLYDATQPSSAGVIKSAITSGSGRGGDYTIQGLAPGAYKIYFEAHNVPAGITNVAYVSRWYNNQTSFDSANQVSVTAGSITSEINAVLSYIDCGYIVGYVKDTSGQGVKDVFVRAYDAAQPFNDQAYQSYSFTGNSGFYQIDTLPPGNYRVLFIPPSGDYLPEWFDNKTSFSSATPIDVQAHYKPTADAVLDPGGRINGQITDESGSPLKGVSVTALPIVQVQDDSIFNFLSTRTATTDAYGGYTVVGLPTANYKVYFEIATGNYLPEYYNDKSQRTRANPVPVKAPQFVSPISAVLLPGNIISGRVTNTAGTGLTNIAVSLYNLGGASIYSTTTDQDGNYRKEGLPDGPYKVKFDPGSAGNYIAEWHNDKSSFGSADIIYFGTFLSVITPNGSEQWGRGSTQNITWVARGVTGTALIELWKDDAFVSTIGTATAASGTFPWTIPLSLPTGSGYAIRISQGNFEDFSDNTFTIATIENSIRVTEPNGGEQWQAGTAHNITWTQSGLSGNVTIQLYRGGALTSTLGTAASTAGTFAWTIPSIQVPGNDYKIRIFQGSLDDYSDANFSILNLTRKFDILGSWSGDGIYSRNSDTGAWTRISSAATQIAAADLDGDGKDDVIGNWYGDAVWVRSSSTGQWSNIASAATCIAAGDLNGDGKTDLIGIWGGTVYARDSASGAWTSISTGASQVVAGDLDGDGKADIIAIWPGAVWVKYSSTGQWTQVSTTTPDWIAVGDLNGDGKADLVGIWGGTIYARDSASGAWTSISTGANQVIAGDLDGDGKADIIGNWLGNGIWVRYSSTGGWQRLGSSADSIATGRLR